MRVDFPQGIQLTTGRSGSQVRVGLILEFGCLSNFTVLSFFFLGEPI